MAVFNGKLWIWNISGTDLLVRADQGGGKTWKNMRVKPGKIESMTLRMEKDRGVIPLPDKHHTYGVKIYSHNDYVGKRPNFWARTIKYRITTGYQILLNAADIGGDYPIITQLDPCDVPVLKDLCEAFDRTIPFSQSPQAEVDEINSIVNRTLEEQRSETERALGSLLEDPDEFEDTIAVND